MPSLLSRRAWMKSAAAAGGMSCAAMYWASDAPARAAFYRAKNDRPLVAAIGVGGRGLYDAKWAAKFGDVVAICDTDLNQAEKAKAALGGKAAVFQDYRKMLDARKDVEAVINVTPDHWHTAINVAVCRAGKDLYAEKPLTLTLDEGKILTRVARETKRVVQVGSQQRSAAHFRTACEVVRNGRIGKLKEIAVLLPLYPNKGGPFEEQPVPAGVDWDLWQGQAPVHPFCPERMHFKFRWWSDYAAGKITDWGQHHMDIAYWGMGMDKGGPLEVEAKAFSPNRGRPGCFDNPDRFTAKMKFPGDIDLYYLVVRDKKYLKSLADGEMTAAEDEALFAGIPDEWKQEQRDGVMFIGEKGRVFVNRGKAYGRAIEELQDNPLPSDAVRLYQSDEHMQNFFDCIKSRKETAATLDRAHRVISTCHLANTALRLGRKLRWDSEKEEIIGDPEANQCRYIRREQRRPYTIEG